MHDGQNLHWWSGLGGMPQGLFPQEQTQYPNVAARKRSRLHTEQLPSGAYSNNKRKQSSSKGVQSSYGTIIRGSLKLLRQLNSSCRWWCCCWCWWSAPGCACGYATSVSLLVFFGPTSELKGLRVGCIAATENRVQSWRR